VAAVSGALGGFGSSILAGDGLKGALRNGLTGAVLAGGMAGITGGSAAFAARPELQAAYQQQGFLGTVRSTAQNYFGSPVDTAKQLYGTEAPTTPQPTGPVPGASEFVSPTDLSRVTPGAEGFGATPTPQLDINVQQGLPPGLPQPSTITGVDLGAPLQPPAGPLDRLTQGIGDLTQGAKDIYSEYLSPSRAGIQGRSADTIFDEFVAKGLPKTADTLKLATETAAKEAPGTFAKYGPIAAVAGTTLAATGGLDSLFKVPEQEPGESYEAYVARRNEAEAKFRQERPEFFGSFLASPNQGIMSTQPVMRAAKGSGPQGVEDFPRKTGAINGPGTGTSDDIPAMLSDGEFVFTAKSVRNMGGGSRRKGAAKMYKLMKMLEGGPVSKTAEA
jgi:hypothetical protein